MNFVAQIGIILSPIVAQGTEPLPVITLVSASVVGLVSICFVQTLSKGSEKPKSQLGNRETDVNDVLLNKSSPDNIVGGSEGLSPQVKQ